ncbi:MAG: hypothetical protein GTN78_13555 [Gemmatimonadales bacterium]|nr:hypothetical protein [Gemmatimonadales bacterium]
MTAVNETEVLWTRRLPCVAEFERTSESGESEGITPDCCWFICNVCCWIMC